MDIWQAVRGYVTPKFLQNNILRVVESQEQIATNSLVNDLEKQALLEEMLDDSKPDTPAGKRTFHYLLATPFRYPPLQYGSRFGAKHEPSLFYGSLTQETAFAETGYYRFLFWTGMCTPPPSNKLVTQHTIFSVQYKTSCGLKLQDTPFNDFHEILLDPANYDSTQRLGSAMRENGVEAFEYVSARDISRGINAALFSADALAVTTPKNQRQWICETSNDNVRFYSVADKTGYSYPLHTYLVDGDLPAAAT